MIPLNKMCHRNLFIVFLVVLLLVFSFCYRPLKAPTETVAFEKKTPFFAGEKIVYAVKMGPLKMGTSTLEFLGKTKLSNRELDTIVFRTTGLNFFDEEKIYAEPDTFYPVRVERTLNLWGRKMDIVEDYDSKDNSWRLTKREGRKITQEVFKSPERIQNFIAVVYFYRQMSDIGISKPLSFNFFTTKVKMQVTKTVDFSIGNKVYQAYLLESLPRKYRVWLDTSERKIPLRIDGSMIGFGNMALLMREFN